MALGFRKEYKIRKVMPNRNHLVVAIPYEIVERAARHRKMTVEQFITTFVVVAEYGDSEEIHYTFKEKVSGN